MKHNIGENDLELLSAYLDGECDDAAALRARLDAEPELSQHLRQLQAVRVRLAALTQPNPPADFAERVTGRAYARKMPAPFRKYGWYAVTVAAAAVLLLVAGLVFVEPRPDAAPVPEAADTLQMAMNALAEAPDAESLAEWAEGDPAFEDASPNDLVGALADRSAEEPEFTGAIDPDSLDSNVSVVDLFDQINDEDAAELTAMLQDGA